MCHRKTKQPADVEEKEDEVEEHNCSILRTYCMQASNPKMRFHQTLKCTFQKLLRTSTNRGALTLVTFSGFGAGR